MSSNAKIAKIANIANIENANPLLRSSAADCGRTGISHERSKLERDAKTVERDPIQTNVGNVGSLGNVGNVRASVSESPLWRSSKGTRCRRF